MSLERRQGSSIGASVRTLLEGDFAAAGGVMDWLQEYRPEDLTYFRLLVGNLAAGALDGAGGEGRLRPVNSSAWDEFRRGVTALFWFELYTPDSTWAALTGACAAVRDGPPRFGFRTG
jgi:hypothetical protein